MKKHWFEGRILPVFAYEEKMGFIALIITAFYFIFFKQLYRGKTKKVLSIFFILLFHLIIFIEIVHYYLFSVKLNQSSIFMILNTNTNEFNEFIENYINPFVVGLFIILLLHAIFFIKTRVLKKKYINQKINFILLMVLMLPGLLFNVYSKSLFYIIPDGFLKFKAYFVNFQDETHGKYGGEFTNVTHDLGENEEVIFVLILGESTTSTHMHLYDYYRKTNPQLTQIKEELTLFRNVISPSQYTVSSLHYSLTLKSLDLESSKRGTLIHLFNHAGFTTFWLSNQMPMGYYERTATMVAKNSQFFQFFSVGNNTFDDILLKPLEEFLSKKDKKKFIVLHLLGTHSIYKNRYPNNFNSFTSTPKTKFKHKKAYTLINNYDNAVLYNDFVVSEIIKTLKKMNKKSFALYISDHGEDVYETHDMRGRSDNITPPMLKIPMILWQSEKFKNSEKGFVLDENRKYSTDNLIHTLSDLANIRFDEFDSTKSIVNEHYLPHKRLIFNKNKIWNYDSLFSE